jgi:hypothetical protein
MYEWLIFFTRVSKVRISLGSDMVAWGKKFGLCFLTKQLLDPNF